MTEQLTDNQLNEWAAKFLGWKDLKPATSCSGSELECSFRFGDSFGRRTIPKDVYVKSAVPCGFGDYLLIDAEGNWTSSPSTRVEPGPYLQHKSTWNPCQDRNQCWLVVDNFYKWVREQVAAIPEPDKWCERNRYNLMPSQVVWKLLGREFCSGSADAFICLLSEPKEVLKAIYEVVPAQFVDYRTHGGAQ